MRHFDVDEVRRVQFLCRMQRADCDALGKRRSQYQLDCRGGIEDDQRASRSARSAWVGDTLPT